MKDNNYIIIPAFLRTRLNLKGSELIIAAIIYGYSQDGYSWFMGSTEYISEWAGISDKNVFRVLRTLTEKGILDKKEVYVNNKAKRCYYRFILECIDSQNSTVAEGQNSTVAEGQNSTVAEGQNSTVAEGQNSTVYNIYKDNIDSDNIYTENSFSVCEGENKKSKGVKKLRGTTEHRSCLFENSRFSNFEDFEKCFVKPEFEKLDILYYYHAVADWSASKGRKQKDWIAQTRNFIRKDKTKGELHLKPEFQPAQSKFDYEGAMEYLKGDYDDL